MMQTAPKILERLAPEDFGKHRITQPEQHNHGGGSVANELLGGRQPVDIPLKTREKIIALPDEDEAETAESDPEA